MDIHAAKSRPLTFAWLSGLAVLCIALYLPALDGPFVFDDLPNIEPARIEILSVDSLLHAATSNESGPLGRPIAAFTFALNDYFGTGTFAFKATNLALHLATMFALFVLSRSVLLLGTHSRHASLLAVATVTLWSLHPLQVSTVMYTVQRMAQLSMLFSVLALIAYMKSRSASEQPVSQQIGWLALTALFFVLALLSKENGALLPFYILALEATVLPDATSRQGRIMRRISVTASIVAVAFLVGGVTAMSDQFAQAYAGRDFSLAERLMAQSEAMIRYLAWIVAPDTTSMTFYHDDVQAPTELGLSVFMASGLLLLLLFSGFAFRQKFPVAAFGVFLFFAAHLLESTVLPLELVFEHRNYFASFGILIALVAILATLTDQLPGRLKIAIVCGPVLLCSILTLQRTEIWATRTSIALEATLNAPRSERAWIDLADSLLQTGRDDLAITVIDDAYTQMPASPHLALQRHRIHSTVGIPDPDVLVAARNALLAGPARPADVMLLVAVVDGIAERKDSSGKADERLRDLAPLFDAIWSSRDRRMGLSTLLTLTYNQHRVLLASGDRPGALAAIRRAVDLNPDIGEVRARLAETLTLNGRFDEARMELATLQATEDLSDPAVSMRLSQIAQQIEARDVGSRRSANLDD